jgi:hypothetical protein
VLPQAVTKWMPSCVGISITTFPIGTDGAGASFTFVTCGSFYSALLGLVLEGRLSVTWIGDVVRVAAAGAALAAFYLAWFVYEDEEKKLQNKIETWWLQFDDFRSHLVSRQAAFVVVVALRATQVLDRLFGPKLLAKDAIATAASLTIGSWYLVVALLLIITRNPRGWAIGAAAVAVLACAFAPLVTPRLRRLPRVIMWLFVAYLVLVSLGALLQAGGSLLQGRPAVEHFSTFFAQPAPGNLVFGVGVSTSIALTMCQVAVVRRAMRSTVAAKSEWPIVTGMAVVAAPIGVLLVASVPVVLRWSVSGTNVTPLTTVVLGVLIIGLGCLVSMALGGLVAAVASMMLLHRLVWPLASRLLYALGPHYRLVQNKAVLNAAGATLAGIAITGAYGWQTILKHFGVA